MPTLKQRENNEKVPRFSIAVARGCTVTVHGPGTAQFLGNSYTPAMKDAANSEKSYQRVWAVVARIPYGRVATYGQVARLAGLGQRARLVGYALHRTPKELRLPWHRVVNAKGEISFASDQANFREQRRRLEGEGIKFLGPRMELERYRWRPENNGLPDEYLPHTR